MATAWRSTLRFREPWPMHHPHRCYCLHLVWLIILAFFLMEVTGVVVEGSMSSEGRCLETERDALLLYKAAIEEHPSARLSSCRPQVDFCAWTGAVVCNTRMGNVGVAPELNLQNPNLEKEEDDTTLREIAIVNDAGASARGLIVSFGEMLIDFVPTESGISLAEAASFLKAPGGAPANVAIAVTRLGGQSAFVGKLGDDEFGRMLAAILRDNGVSDSGVVFDSGARTALAFVTLLADGEREFMFYRNPSADMLLTEAELNVDLIRKASIFHYGSISLISEPCRSAHLKAMELAKKAGALLSFDPNLRLPLWPSPEEARKQILSIWNQTDIAKVSEVELAFLTSHDSVDDEVAMLLWHPNLKLLLVTLGDKGCKYYTKDFRGVVGSFAVKQVDSTGAGDAFVGGLLRGIEEDQSALQDEKKLRDVLKFANACGAITVTKKGVIPSLPNVSEVMQFLERA